jgi:hypothetical protein
VLDHVFAAFNSGMVAPLVPVFTAAAVPSAVHAPSSRKKRPVELPGAATTPGVVCVNNGRLLAGIGVVVCA